MKKQHEIFNGSVKKILDNVDDLITKAFSKPNEEVIDGYLKGLKDGTDLIINVDLKLDRVSPYFTAFGTSSDRLSPAPKRARTLYNLNLDYRVSHNGATVVWELLDVDTVLKYILADSLACADDRLHPEVYMTNLKACRNLYDFVSKGHVHPIMSILGLLDFAGTHNREHYLNRYESNRLQKHDPLWTLDDITVNIKPYNTDRWDTNSIDEQSTVALGMSGILMTAYDFCYRRYHHSPLDMSLYDEVFHERLAVSSGLNTHVIKAMTLLKPVPVREDVTVPQSLKELFSSSVDDPSADSRWVAVPLHPTIEAVPTDATKDEELENEEEDDTSTIEVVVCKGLDGLKEALYDRLSKVNQMVSESMEEEEEEEEIPVPDEKKSREETVKELRRDMEALNTRLSKFMKGMDDK